jgi:hypothetical protein
VIKLSQALKEIDIRSIVEFFVVANASKMPKSKKNLENI